MSTQALTTNSPTVFPSTLNVSFVEANGRPAHIELSARWDQGAVGEHGCDPRELSGQIPLAEGHPIVLDVVREDSLFGEREPSKLTHPMLTGLVDALRGRIAAHTQDPGHVIKSVILASKICPVLLSQAPIEVSVSIPGR